MEHGALDFPSLKALKKEDSKAFDNVWKSIRKDGAYVEAGENDNVIVQKLEANKDAYGIFGYSFLEGESGGSDEIRREIAGLFRGLSQEEIRDDAILKAKVKSAVKRVLKRNEAGIPLIIPVVMGI